MSENCGPGIITRPTIVLVIATLGAGGAERVMTLLAGEWARRNCYVTLITLDGVDEDYYQMADGVKRVGLDLLWPSRGRVDVIKNNVQRLFRLRSAITAEKPNVVISFMDSTNILVLMATGGLRLPVIVSERIDPRHYPIASGWGWLRRKLYPKAAAVVVQTAAVAEWAREFIPAGKVHVIPNPVAVAGKLRIAKDESQISEAPSAEKLDLPDWLPQDRFVVAMGRLNRQKGFDLLLPAFAALPQEFLDYRLIIMGEGPERVVLERLAAELGIGSRVLMPGRIKDPGPIMKQAECFVLSSRFEGFPNALLEAMAVGLPVISFKCPSGPADIITHDRNGLLVEPEDVPGMSAAIAQVLGAADLRHRLGNSAQSEMSTYSLEKVTDQWEQLINLRQ